MKRGQVVAMGELQDERLASKVIKRCPDPKDNVLPLLSHSYKALEKIPKGK